MCECRTARGSTTARSTVRAAATQAATARVAAAHADITPMSAARSPQLTHVKRIPTFTLQLHRSDISGLYFYIMNQ